MPTYAVMCCRKHYETDVSSLRETVVYHSLLEMPKSRSHEVRLAPRYSVIEPPERPDVI